MRLPITLLVALIHGVLAINDPVFVAFEPSSGSLDISQPTIIVDDCDHPGVRIAANSLSEDFLAITSSKPEVVIADNTTTEFSIDDGAVIIGSIDSSCLIQRMVDAGTLDVEPIAGKWETFSTIILDEPLPGIGRALVIVGSDKRGAIYGAFTLSEQIGVSPWYWWADTLPKQHSAIHALSPSTTHGPPSVQYRGLFLNDEYPGLTEWVRAHFGPVLNSEFYKHLFELLLRLKANYLWPASWPGYPLPGQIFFTDDPENHRIADEYGIVVSTSHHEPMQRATNEWLNGGLGAWDWQNNKANITKFFEEGARRAHGKESYYTIDMRGAGDSGLGGPNPAATLREVFDVQRQIIADVYGNETAVPQSWPLYKEVQALYEAGLDIPDDVTLMFADDNFGQVRRFPTAEERERSGGIGLYYHLGYVGTPRAYKWLNTNSLGKVQQQFSAAYEAGIDRIWVINVGDLKPMETPITLVMAMAWNASSVTHTSLPSWLETYATREFPEEHAEEIADLILMHGRLMGLRRHATTESTTYSLLNYNEAQTVLDRWTALLDRALALEEKLPEDVLPSFYELVLHPIQASQTYFAIRINQSKNTQYGLERRNTANEYAQDVLNLFDIDYDVEERYHTMLDGKWDNILRQPHYGYIAGSYYTPYRNMITGLSYVQLRQASSPSMGQMGVSAEGHPGVRTGNVNEGNDITHPSRGDLRPAFTTPTLTTYGRNSSWFDVWGRGVVDIQWSATPAVPWVSISPISGTLSKDAGWEQRVSISVDWAQAPANFNSSTIIRVNTTVDSYEEVTVPIVNTAIPASFQGFVEGDSVVAIEAAHFTSSAGGTDDVHYEEFPWLSRTLADSGAVGLIPQTAVSSIPGGPHLEYKFYQVTPLNTVNVTLFFTTSLDTDPDVPRTFAFSLDGSEPQVTRFLSAPATPGDLPLGWTVAVQDLVWRHSKTFPSGRGEHTLRYWAGTGGVLLERIIINMGGLRTSYLGPPESRRV